MNTITVVCGRIECRNRGPTLPALLSGGVNERLKRHRGRLDPGRAATDRLVNHTHAHYHRQRPHGRAYRREPFTTDCPLSQEAPSPAGPGAGGSTRSDRDEAAAGSGEADTTAGEPDQETCLNQNTRGTRK